jgi:hypothetical protein
MLCGVISAVTEFMVMVLHLMVELGFPISLGLKPAHACDVINVVVQFMPVAAGVESQHAHDQTACLSGVHFRSGR